MDNRNTFNKLYHHVLDVAMDEQLTEEELQLLENFLLNLEIMHEDPENTETIEKCRDDITTLISESINDPNITDIRVQILQEILNDYVINSNDANGQNEQFERTCDEAIQAIENDDAFDLARTKLLDLAGYFTDLKEEHNPQQRSQALNNISAVIDNLNPLFKKNERHNSMTMLDAVSTLTASLTLQNSLKILPRGQKHEAENLSGTPPKSPDTKRVKGPTETTTKADHQAGAEIKRRGRAGAGFFDRASTPPQREQEKLETPKHPKK